MNSNFLSWFRAKVPEQLHTALEVLAEEYPLQEKSGGREIVLTPVKDKTHLTVQLRNNSFLIEYGTMAAALRGLGYALAGLETECSENSFESLGIMLDCSRNAVMKVEHLKRWMRRLALIGYNRIMLYTEETYQLPGEPFFGYMRGAYSAEEIRELDDYAHSLGLEMMACIQTLGHMEQILMHKHYGAIADSPYVMLVDEEKTEALIEKMLTFWSENLRCRRIHIGMDEAHTLGRGSFLDKHGYEPQFSIFNRHLGKVCAICERLDLKPMIWSDMYFRMGNQAGDYYSRDTVIEEDVRAEIPETVDLVYWDYYHDDEEFYREWIRRHRELGYEPIMASGIWTWSRFWYDHFTTVSTVVPCLNACRRENLREVFFTMWGDGGSYCEFDSALAGLTWAGDLAWGGQGDESRLAAQFQAICGGDYKAHLIAQDLMIPLSGKGLETQGDAVLAPTTVLWDDPLLGIGWQGYLHYGADFWSGILLKYRDLYDRLEPFKTDNRVADLAYPHALCNVLIKKLEFRTALLEAWTARDMEAIRQLVRETIPAVLKALDVLQEVFRRQWLRRNKPLGMEVIQVRMGAVQTRFREAATRLQEFADGVVPTIEELEAAPADLPGNPVRFFPWLISSSNLI